MMLEASTLCQFKKKRTCVFPVEVNQSLGRDYRQIHCLAVTGGEKYFIILLFDWEIPSGVPAKDGNLVYRWYWQTCTSTLKIVTYMMSKHLKKEKQDTSGKVKSEQKKKKKKGAEGR